MNGSSFIYKLLTGLDIFITLIKINLTFLLVNIGLFIYLYLLSTQKVGMYLFLLMFLLFPLSVSLFALYSSVDDLISQKVKVSIKTFFYDMRKIMTKELFSIFALVYSTAGILALYSLEIDSLSIAVLLPIYLLIICINLLALPILCVEIKTFSNSNIGHLKNTIILLLGNWKLIIFQMIYVALFYLILKELPALILFIGSSLFAYLFLIIYKPYVVKRVAQIKSGEK